MAAKYIYDLDGCESPFTIKVEVRLKLKFINSKMSESQIRGVVHLRRQTGQEISLRIINLKIVENITDRINNPFVLPATT